MRNGQIVFSNLWSRSGSQILISLFVCQCHPGLRQPHHFSLTLPKECPTYHQVPCPTAKRCTCRCQAGTCRSRASWATGTRAPSWSPRIRPSPSGKAICTGRWVSRGRRGQRASRGTADCRGDTWRSRAGPRRRPVERPPASSRAQGGWEAASWCSRCCGRGSCSAGWRRRSAAGPRRELTSLRSRRWPKPPRTVGRWRARKKARPSFSWRSGKKLFLFFLSRRQRRRRKTSNKFKFSSELGTILVSRFACRLHEWNGGTKKWIVLIVIWLPPRSATRLTESSSSSSKVVFSLFLPEFFCGVWAADKFQKNWLPLLSSYFQFELSTRKTSERRRRRRRRRCCHLRQRGAHSPKPSRLPFARARKKIWLR